MKPDPTKHAESLLRNVPEYAEELAEANSEFTTPDQRHYWLAVLAEVKRLKARKEQENA